MSLETCKQKDGPQNLSNPYGPLVFFQSTTSALKIGFSPLKTGLDYNVDVALLSPHFCLTIALAGLHVYCMFSALVEPCVAGLN